mmetsp:Transcript_26308/g.88739  ORF Transcript_26308/g.88739 Transcript_26308/m.88739 type:complete len:296 (-) Transcript_26308:439-1326(-)
MTYWAASEGSSSRTEIARKMELMTAKETAKPKRSMKWPTRGDTRMVSERQAEKVIRAVPSSPFSSSCVPTLPSRNWHCSRSTEKMSTSSAYCREPTCSRKVRRRSGTYPFGGTAAGSARAGAAVTAADPSRRDQRCTSSTTSTGACTVKGRAGQIQGAPAAQQRQTPACTSSMTGTLAPARCSSSKSTYTPDESCSAPVSAVVTRERCAGKSAATDCSDSETPEPPSASMKKPIVRPDCWSASLRPAGLAMERATMLVPSAQRRSETVTVTRQPYASSARPAKRRPPCAAHDAIV